MESESQEDGVYLFGIKLPDMTTQIQPLECMVLVKGINMEDGTPTMTAIGSEGITPWEAVGMMQMESERIKFMTVYATMVNEAQESSEQEEE